MLAFGLLIPAMLLGTAGAKQDRRKLLSLLFVFLVLGACLFQSACGGSGSNSQTTPPPSGGTPAGSYTVTVTGSSNGLQHTVSPNMTLTVQ